MKRIFKKPVFPETCHIFRFTTPIAGAPDVVSSCELIWGPWKAIFIQDSTFSAVGRWMYLPFGTDIRGHYNMSTIVDLVRYPITSSHYYKVLDVDVVARGFTNAFVAAILIPHWVPDNTDGGGAPVSGGGTGGA